MTGTGAGRPPAQRSTPLSPPAKAAAAYGLDPGLLQPVSSRYRTAAAWRAGSVVLKPYRYPERQLWHAVEALRHLEAQNFRLAPRLVLTTDGQPYTQSGGLLWYALTWLDGRPPDLPADLPAAARSLAAFHLASLGCVIPWSPNRSWPRRYQAVLLDLASFRRRAQAGSTPFDRAFARAAPHFEHKAAAAVDLLANSDYPRLEQAVRTGSGFCHRDCTAPNLLVDRAGRVCLIDPDTWGAELRLYDVARLIHTGSNADPVAALRALEVYESLTPLDPGERSLLPAALSLPREFWWAGLCRYRRPQPGPDPERLLMDAITGAPAWDACIHTLTAALMDG